MTDHYIDIMKVALKEVHPLLNDSSFLNGYSDNTLWNWDKFHEYVSYRGLKDTEAGGQYFNDLTNNISLYLQGTESNSNDDNVEDKIEAKNGAQQRFGDCNNPNGNSLHNTIGDAYRHAYFAALNTQNMGYNNAKTLGDAHECETKENELDEKEMDLNNNHWGYLYGDTMSYVNETHFYTSFMDAFQDGQIKIL